MSKLHPDFGFFKISDVRFSVSRCTILISQTLSVALKIRFNTQKIVKRNICFNLIIHLRVKIICFIDFKTPEITCLATWQIKTSNTRGINWFFKT